MTSGSPNAETTRPTATPAGISTRGLAGARDVTMSRFFPRVFVGVHSVPVHLWGKLQRDVRRMDVLRWATVSIVCVHVTCLEESEIEKSAGRVYFWFLKRWVAGTLIPRLLDQVFVASLGELVHDVKIINFFKVHFPKCLQTLILV